ncbi:hypothetical protein JW707_01580 [Candidatus Woesearchaeota archaeon]|nr:hypothetical protein [Candidatus Woesearchaeota archaeon]
MAKKDKPRGKMGHIVLLIVIVVVVLLVLKYRAPSEEPKAAEEVKQAPAAEEQVEEAPEAAEEAQPLYPDLCYAEGGIPRAECKSGEKSIGEVPGFKVPNFCCVPK